VWLLAMLVAGSGCALAPPPKTAEIGKEALPHLQLPAQWTAGTVAGEVQGNWLASFGDPVLQSLVAEAIANNPDLRVAAARVAVASQYAELAGSSLWPQVNLRAAGGGDMSGDSSGLQGAGVYADWELDLWGRLRSAKSGQYATYVSVAADAEYARQSIAALAAKSYFLAAEAGLQQRLAEDMVAAASKLVTLVEQRERVGSSDSYEVALAHANVETFSDSVEQFKLAREQALRALEALLGRYPSAQVPVAAQLPDLPGPVPAGLPSELLERRPDVIAADQRVVAAFYGVQEAKAARLPRIALTASVTDITSDLFVLQDRDNPVWSVGANLLLPLFTGGALKHQVEIRTLEQKQAIAQYGQVGARAFGEVEDALSAEFASKRREVILGRAVVANERAAELAQVRYRVGSADLRGVQQQQIAVHAARTSLVRVQAEQLVQRVNVYLALGGGFDATGAPTPVAAAKE
jgi:NodT family efflux transporter outer membrane factor (OMF) lipoprotein